MTQLSNLVEQYAQGVSPENLRNLQTLFSSLKNDRDRAETLERAAFAQMDTLAKRLSIFENGEKPPKPPRESQNPTKTQTMRSLVAEAKPPEKKPSGAIEIEF